MQDDIQKFQFDPFVRYLPVMITFFAMHEIGVGVMPSHFIIIMSLIFLEAEYIYLSFIFKKWCFFAFSKISYSSLHTFLSQQNMSLQANSTLDSSPHWLSKPEL